MKIFVDKELILEISDLQLKVFCNEISKDKVHDDLKRRLKWSILHKYNACLNRLQEEWVPKLAELGHKSVPLDKERVAELIFSLKSYRSASDKKNRRKIDSQMDTILTQEEAGIEESVETEVIEAQSKQNKVIKKKPEPKIDIASPTIITSFSDKAKSNNHNFVPLTFNTDKPKNAVKKKVAKKPRKARPTINKKLKETEPIEVEVIEKKKVAGPYDHLPEHIRKLIEKTTKNDQK